MNFKNPYVAFLEQTIESLTKTNNLNIQIEQQNKAYTNKNNKELYTITIKSTKPDHLGRPDWRSGVIVYNPTHDLEPQRIRKSLFPEANKNVAQTTNKLYQELKKHVQPTS
jgi:hypothetical protein